MIGFKHARLVNSNLDLNGPKLSFTTQPVSTTTSQADGTMSFTAAAVGAFPAGQTERSTNTGSIAFQWYKNGLALSDGTNVAGSKTSTLSLSGLKYGDNNSVVSVEIDYLNSAYDGGLTPNAYNEPRNSNAATIFVEPLISIVQQPVQTTASEGIPTTFSVTAFAQDEQNDKLSFEWFIDGVSINKVDYLPTISRSVSNSFVFVIDNLPNSPSYNSEVQARESRLTLNSSEIGFHKVKVVITHPNTNPGSITSNEVDYDVATSRKLIDYEVYDVDDPLIVETGRRDIESYGPLIFRANRDPQRRAIAIWAPERDVEVKITLGGGAGADPFRTVSKGGQGGISVFKVTLKKNEEYQIKLGINDSLQGGPRGGTPGGGGSSILYHQSRVIAVCGGGGGSGRLGKGGDGGGIQVAGEQGGARGGNGGSIIEQGLLPSDAGSFPNNTAGTQLSGCTIGSYWRDQGFSPCESIGLQKYRSANGLLYQDSAEIIRGYKAGLAHRNNGGTSISLLNGGGGAGVNGGSAGSNSFSGGGGGSGYAAGDIELLPSAALQTGTQLGGNDDVGFISIEEGEPGGARGGTGGYDPNDDQKPNIPLATTGARPYFSTFLKYTFTVTRSSSNLNTVTYTRQSGTGPDQITFGPTAGTNTAQVEVGSVYERTGTTSRRVPAFVGDLRFRVVDGALQVSEDGVDFTTLTVSLDSGSFSGSDPEKFNGDEGQTLIFS